MARFFIERPIFAAVIAVLIALGGLISIPSLPVSNYPSLALPQVVVTAVYTGASSQVVEATVTQPLEQAINGVEGMRYIESASSNDGVSTITITFERERDLDIATVDVQNRVATALGRLPAEVRAIGVDVRRASQAIVVGIGLYADEGTYDTVFISNYADRYLRDALKRVDGVGEVRIFGERIYAMRLWLDPARLASFGLSANEVVDALREQNLQVAAGALGRPPTTTDQTFQISLSVQGRLREASEFEEIIVRAGEGGSLVRIRDVGRVELGAESYTTNFRFTERDAVGIGVYQLPSANALDVLEGVREQMEELEADFPPGLHYDPAFNPTEVVEESIDEVIWTLLGSIVLVIAVIYLFLQRVGTTLVPVLTIPVSLVGTFLFVRLAGFSINNLTLFGLTLAVGLVVDDAIVVIENIERHARERGGTPRQAAVTGTQEVFGAVIAIGLVLSAVFAPVAMFPGTTGILYQQFALTIAFAIVLSVVTALTLTPALSAMLVRPSHGSPRGFFKWFEAGLNRLRAGYRWSLERVLSPAGLAGTAVAFIALCALVGVIWQRVPTGFVPVEDQGYFIVIVQAPEGTSLERTSQIVARIEGTLLDDEDIESTFVPIGFSFEGTAPNRATLFPILRERAERDGEEHTAEAVMARMQVAFSSIPEASIVAIPPPPIRGLGNLGGFELRLEDRIDSGLASLDQQTSQLTAAANADPRVTNTFSTFQANDPQFRVDVDRDRARALGVPLDELFGTIQVLLGSVYVNDFELEARPYRVYVQADAPYRTHPQDIDELYVRSNTGRMVPLANLVQLEEEATPQIISHFNMFRSATINGGASPGSSSGDAIDAMTELSDRELPPGFAIEWSGLAQEELESRGQTATLFGLGLLVIFLILAAQYESVVLPFVILLSVPMAVLGAIGAQALRGLTNDVFCQVGLLMLVGLAAKNAILIVEFVEQLRKEQGKPLREAVVEACAVRLRPILMTSFAFIMGVIPLVVAGGAGQAARQSLGTAVFGGMIVSTVLNLFVVPVAYMLTVRIRDRVGALMPSSRQPKKAESVPAE